MIKGKLEGKKGAALADLAARLGDLDARQERAQAEGVPALRRLVAVAQRDTGQSRVVGRFLLGLWNGSAYGFDLTELRGLDTALHDDCLAVLRLDHTPAREVHQYIEDGDRLWQELRERYIAQAQASLAQKPAAAEEPETERLDWVLLHRPEFEDGYLRVWLGVSSDGAITRAGHYVAEGATPRECIDNAMAGKLRLID